MDYKYNNSKLFKLNNLLKEYKIAKSDEDDDEAEIAAIIYQSDAVDCVKNIVCDVFEMTSQIEKLKKIQEIAKEKQKKIESKIDKNKNVLKDAMSKLEINKIDDDFFKISIRKNPPKLQIIDEAKISKNYIVEKIENVVDKYRLKMDIMNGVIVEGARVVSESRLDIKN